MIFNTKIGVLTVEAYRAGINRHIVCQAYCLNSKRITLKSGPASVKVVLYQHILAVNNYIVVLAQIYACTIKFSKQAAGCIAEIVAVYNRYRICAVFIKIYASDFYVAAFAVEIVVFRRTVNILRSAIAAVPDVLTVLTDIAVIIACVIIARVAVCNSVNKGEIVCACANVRKG